LPMYFDKRWPMAAISLAIGGLALNRIWDQLSMKGGLGTMPGSFGLVLLLFAGVVYLIIGLANDLMIALFGRKHLEREMAKIFSKWLADEKAELEYWPENILEEKALSKVKSVWGLKEALRDHFSKVAKKRDELEAQLRRANLDTQDLIDKNADLRGRLDTVKRQYSDYQKECDSRLRELELLQGTLTTEKEGSIPTRPQQTPAPMSPASPAGDEIPPLQVARPIWTEPIAAPKEAKYFQDPIYGVISLDEELAYIFAQPIVQRLSRIRQLSFSYLTFPSATHTRLAHSLGMCRNAEKALDGILSRDVLYSQSRAQKPIPVEELDPKLLLRKCKVGALLHDLGHGPFGHALDKYVGFLDPQRARVSPDKDYTIKYIREYLAAPLREIGLDAEGMVRILDKKSRVALSGFDVLVADIIDSPLDVDRIDYLVRDGAMTGLITSAGSADALIEMMRPFESNDAISLSFDVRALPAIENLLYLRDFMYVNCYELPEKLAAERAFERIVGEAVTAGLLSIDRLMLLTDEDVLDVLMRLGQSRPSMAGLVQSLLRNTLYEEVFSCKPSESPNPEIRSWVHSRLMGAVGGGLRQAYVALPRVWERRIAQEAGIGADREWEVLVSVPSYFAYVQKESGARILLKEGGGWRTVDLFDYSQKLGKILEQMRPASAYIRVFACATATTEEKDRIGAAATALLS